jgi:galactokinase
MKQQLVQEFKKIFGDGGEIQTYFAPGRVNLIGEHTDYNGGHVFPCALTIGTYAVARKNNSTKLRFYSKNFAHLGILEGDVEDLTYKKEDGWINYPKGIIWTMKQRGFEIPQGMDILYYGTIPNGSGLSSSASIEVLTGFVLKNMWNLSVSNQDLALIGQYSENNYNGVNCGIMDQFAIAMGQKNKAIFLDTATLDYEYADIDLGDCKIVILNTNKKRGLGDSKYNERRAECEEALSELQKVVKIDTLGDLDEQQFEIYKSAIKDSVRQKRAKHAVYENQRTVKAVQALKEGKLEEFGQLMIASHKSLQYDYEVTGIELDTLVDAALKQEGVIGARMTGAGFGGCAVSIVKEDAIEKFIENVGKEYKDKIGYNADFYVVEVGNGPMLIG